MNLPVILFVPLHLFVKHRVYLVLGSQQPNSTIKKQVSKSDSSMYFECKPSELSSMHHLTFFLLKLSVYLEHASSMHHFRFLLL